jgi:hypothetical protein
VAQEKKSGISVSTLAISAVAAVAAAVVVPMFWERGTLVATAMTPVIVAVVSEALKKPVQVVSAATPKVTRRTTAARTARREQFEPLPPDERGAAPGVREDDPFGLRTAQRPARHHWKLALGTGAAAFAIAVVALTGSELVFGGPATKDSGRTTFIPGNRSQDERKDASPTPTATPTATATEDASPSPTPTPTATPTVTPQPTPTVSATPAPREAAPTPTVTPAP